MRNTTISSSIASVVSRVIVSIAGAVRNFLCLTSMREHMGCWLEPGQLGFAFAGAYCSYPANKRQAADMQPGKPGGRRQLRRSGIALAVCTTPFHSPRMDRLTSVTAISRG